MADQHWPKRISLHFMFLAYELIFKENYALLAQKKPGIDRLKSFDGYGPAILKATVD